VIVPVLIAFLALILAYMGSRKQLSKMQFTFVSLFFVAGGLCVLFPGMTNRVAATLNVGRGADLLLYFSVLCGVLIAANFYFRFKETERALAEVVRQLALQSPVRPASEKHGKP